MFLVGEFGTFVIFFAKMTVWQNLNFRISPTTNIKVRLYLGYKAYNVDNVEKEAP